VGHTMYLWTFLVKLVPAPAAPVSALRFSAVPSSALVRGFAHQALPPPAVGNRPQSSEPVYDPIRFLPRPVHPKAVIGTESTRSNTEIRKKKRDFLLSPTPAFGRPRGHEKEDLAAP
jgi:hypothetical protein